jgi:hypothetical protein
VLVEDGDNRWLNGVDLFSYPPPAGVAQWNPCNDDGTSGVKMPGDSPEEAIFDPVAIYLEVQCTTAFYADLQERARVSLEAGTPKAVEFLFATGEGAGVGGNTNPFLGDGNVVHPAGAGGLAPREALAILEDYAAIHYGAQGMIHASPGTVDALSPYLYEGDPGEFYTPSGTPIVSGMGYAGITSKGLAAPANQAWMHISSPVEVRMSEVVQHDLVSSLDRSDNTLSFITERFVLVTWDTLLQAGVLVDWSLAS